MREAGAVLGWTVALSEIILRQSLEVVEKADMNIVFEIDVSHAVFLVILVQRRKCLLV